MNRVFFDDVTDIVIPRPRFIQEHKKLLQVLKDKKPQELENERKYQEKELKTMLRGSGTHRENFLKKYNLEDRSYSLEELAKISGEPLVTLKKVADRGYGAYSTQPKSVRMKGSFKKGVDAPMSKKLSANQWSRARVFSYLDGNPKHDNDLRK
jgi:hypothetical protein